MVIPAEITSKHKVVQEEVFRRGPQAAGIEAAVFEFATLAHDHLNTARSMLGGDRSEDPRNKVPKESLPVFLAGVSGLYVQDRGACASFTLCSFVSFQVPVSNYLGRLEKSQFDAFDSKLQRKDGWLPLQMWKCSLKVTF